MSKKTEPLSITFSLPYGGYVAYGLELGTGKVFIEDEHSDVLFDKLGSYKEIQKKAKAIRKALKESERKAQIMFNSLNKEQ